MMTSSLRRAGKLGRRPHDPQRPALVLDEFLDPGAITPATTVVDWTSLVTQWPMYDNDQYGCCVWAAIGHMIQAWTTYASGVTLEVPAAALLGGYSAVTGFDPSQTKPDGTNPTDNGTVIADALSYWQKTGVAGHKILAYAQIKNVANIEPALRLFGALMVGVNFPQSAMNQFNANAPWTVVDGSSSVGGHCVHVGYDGSDFRCVTWGAVQEISLPWWQEYVEEVWVPITPEWLSATGTSPSGLDRAGLGHAFTDLTGQPDPFTNTTPAAADRSLASTLRGWLSGTYLERLATVPHLTEEAVAWLRSKKLLP